MSTPNPPDQSAAIKAALLSGNRIKAIQLYRVLTNVGLAEAKSAVEKMEAEIRHSASPELVIPMITSQDHTDAIKSALFAGRKITAIQLYREQTKVGLAEAKDAVEKVEAQLRLSSPELFTPRAAGKGCLAAAMLLAVLGLGLWKVLA